MKAITHTRFGPPDVLTLVDVPKPAPGRGEVLIKIHATTVTAAECGMRRGEPRWGRVVLGFRRPRKRLRTLGLEFSGEVEAVGPGVRRFAPGDEVFGFTGFRPGALAQYKCLPEAASVELRPMSVSHEQAAAAVDGATTADYFLTRAGVKAGDKVLVNGASGSLGTYGVQLAKLLGAEVTAVCGARNAELVRELGADHVIDYARHDFTRDTGAYDVIFDALGKSTFAKARAALTARGRYAPTTGLPNAFLAVWTALRPGKKVVGGMSVRKNAALARVRELVDAGELAVVIDRTYPIEDIVAAHRYVDTGHKVGNVVITVDHVRS